MADIRDRKDESDSVEARERDEDGVEVPRRRAQEAPSSDGTRKGLLIVVPLLMAAAAVVALVFTGIEDNGIYAKPVDELLKNKSKFANREVKADGYLVHGSLTKRESPCEYRFRVEKNGAEIPVSFKQCAVPDTFRDVPDMNVEVTVQGKLLADNSFEATQIIAKCPSKYEMKEKAQKGEKAPHAMQ
jgi:cytochrome c-type biogenesis protein CcmE